MARDNDIDIRAEIVEVLLDEIARDEYPSVTMLDMVEHLANSEERDRYARLLLDKVRSSPYPSVPMMRRLVELV